jgi:hypothetical protein
MNDCINITCALYDTTEQCSCAQYTAGWEQKCTNYASHAVAVKFDTPGKNTITLQNFNHVQEKP